MSIENIERIVQRERSVRARQRFFLGGFLVAIAIVLTALVTM